jgi:hypothetical protein
MNNLRRVCEREECRDERRSLVSRRRIKHRWSKGHRCSSQPTIVRVLNGDSRLRYRERLDSLRDSTMQQWERLSPRAKGWVLTGLILVFGLIVGLVLTSLGIHSAKFSH